MHAIRLHETGGPEVLRYEEVDTPEPGEGQVLVRIEAAGVNFIDIYHRTGKREFDVPGTLGMEAAGVVEAVGAGVEDLREGDRVAYPLQPGAYAEAAVVDADAVVPVPDGTSSELAAAMMLQGCTAHYLVHSTFPLQSGHTALVHAAAGGVGHLIVQVAKRRGARVFGTASSKKIDLVLEAGADEAIDYTQVDFAEEVDRLTDGAGVDVVYDSVGKETFDRSLAVLRPRGYLVLFGQSSGPVEPVDPHVLREKGSVFLTRPTLTDYVATRDELRQRAGDVLDWLASGELKLRIDHTWPLNEAQEAHRYLEGRQSTGKLLLIP